MTALCKTWVYGLSLAGNAGSNSAGGMDVSVVCVVCCQRFPPRADHSSRVSKTWVYGLSLAGIAGSNSAGGMDVSPVCAVCCQRFPPRADHSSRGVLLIMLCLRVIVNS